MSKSLFVGGREYVQSAELARLFGYTPDYLSRLAREKKVTAACIDRKWFIEKGSFKEFVQQVKSEKNNRSRELQRQRKVEQLSYNFKKKQMRAKKRAQVYIALAQSTAVLMCSAIVGILGFTVSANNIHIATLIDSTKSVSLEFAQAILPEVSTFDTHPYSKLFATVFTSRPNNFTIPTRDIYNNETRITEVDNSLQHFSDDIEILSTDENGTVLRPVFQNGTPGPTYRISRESLK